MSVETLERPEAARAIGTDFDAIVIGAGFAGLYALHRLRKSGYAVRILEAGSGVGGTWYWNRYPGARVDIESHEYSYSFDDELQQEWVWSERYPAQPELMRYLNHVADRFGLRPDIQFNTRVTAARYDEDRACWLIETAAGERFSARFCVMATGLLAAPNKPEFPGLDSFKGRQFHTAQWPRETVDFTGRRVGVIGTGSSAVQSIPLIAEQAAHLTVFQRTPAFCIPANNRPNTPETDRALKARYAELRHIEHEISFGGFFLTNSRIELPTLTTYADATPEERLAEFERRYQSGGLNCYSTYSDIVTNRQANEALGEFVRAKIRQRIKNPEIAEKLIPRGWPILTKRLCADTNYYETYDRDNVTLVDVKETPIESFTPEGIRVDGTVYLLDDVVFATGFDALTGSLTRIDIRGRDGRSLKEEWAQGPQTFLGFMVEGFPNLFMMNGPGSPGAVFQPVLLGQFQGDWLADCFDWMRLHQRRSIEATKPAQDEWIKHCNEVAEATLFPEANSWYMGANIPGKTRVILIYLGGFLEYRRRFRAASEDGYAGFALTG